MTRSGSTTIDDIGPATMRQVTRRLMPILMLGYVIALLDRANVAVASLTMGEAIGLTAAQYGLGAGLFFLTYVILEAPSNAILVKVGARRWLARIMITWGIVSAATAFVEGAGSFYGIRLLLGAAEAGFFPGVIYYLSRWFPQAYRAKMIGFIVLCAPLTLALGNPLGGLILGMDGFLGLAGWQLVFLIEALPALLLGFVVLRFLTDEPEQASWLPADKRTWLVRTLTAERAHIERERPMSVRRVFSDRGILTLAACMFMLQASQTGLILWMPQIMKGTFGGSSNLVITVLSAAPYLVAFIAAYVGGRSADRHGRLYLHIAIPGLVSAVGLALTLVTGSGVAGFVALAIGGGAIAGAIPAFWKVCTLYTTGLAAAVAVAVINAIGSLSGFVVPTAIGAIQESTGSFALPMLALACAGVLAALLAAAIKRQMHRQAPEPAASLTPAMEHE